MPQPEKRPTHLRVGLFSVIFAPPLRGVASSMHFVRDIAFGSDMRFARWELQGEYNITVSKANNITFAEQKYHADEVSISLKRFTTHNYYDIL